MSALTARPVGRGRGVMLVCGCVAVVGCRPKATDAECDELLDRYARLVVTEQFPDASAEQVKTERERERSEARADDAFKNCSSEVGRAELECAMRAPNANAFEKCLE
jgi:hypothetical protein